MSERKCLYIPVVSHDKHIRRVGKRFECLKFELSTVCVQCLGVRIMYSNKHLY